MTGNGQFTVLRYQCVLNGFNFLPTSQICKTSTLVFVKDAQLLKKKDTNTNIELQLTLTFWSTFLLPDVRSPLLPNANLFVYLYIYLWFV